MEKSSEGPKEEEENRPPTSHSSRIPRKIRPRRRKWTSRQQHLPGTNENSPGIDLRPMWMKRTPPKHPQPPQQPMRIRLGSISGTKLTLAGFISRPKEAESRNPPNDLVETTSPDHLPPSSLNGLVETTSPGPHHIPELAKALTQSLVPQPQTHQGCTQAGPQGRAISLQQSG